MSIEVMKQALEALEKCAVTIDWEWGDCRELEEMRQTGQYTDETTPAILALRQAIEQEEQREPVAWMTPTGALYRTEDVDGCFDYKHIPLYTTPPQRKPLTDEEIDEIYMANCYSDTLTFVRAIERAHGIGG